VLKRDVKLQLTNFQTADAFKNYLFTDPSSHHFRFHLFYPPETWLTSRCAFVFLYEVALSTEEEVETTLKLSENMGKLQNKYSAAKMGDRLATIHMSRKSEVGAWVSI